MTKEVFDETGPPGAMFLSALSTLSTSKYSGALFALLFTAFVVRRRLAKKRTAVLRKDKERVVILGATR